MHPSIWERWAARNFVSGSSACSAELVATARRNKTIATCIAADPTATPKRNKANPTDRARHRHLRGGTAEFCETTPVLRHPADKGGAPLTMPPPKQTLCVKHGARTHPIQSWIDSSQAPGPSTRRRKLREKPSRLHHRPSRTCTRASASREALRRLPSPHQQPKHI